MKIKQFLTAMLAAAVLVTTPSPAFLGEGIGSACTIYAASDTVVTTGKCGDNLTYTVTGDKESGYAISITGTGDMYDYGLDDWAAPWCDYSLRSISIGDDVTSIGAYAFVEAGPNVKLTIGNSVKQIRKSAFSDADIKGTLTIPDSVESIGVSAFDGTPITKLILGKGVKELETYAFTSCTSLKTVDASKSTKLQLIGSSCFASTKLSTMKINANKLKTIGTRSFYNTSNTMKITVIAKTKKAYKKAVKLLNGSDVHPNFKFTYKKG